MERLIELSGVTLVTICSMALALLIEVALLKFIFHCLAHVKAAAVVEPAPAPDRRWMRRTMVSDLRKAGL